MTLRRKPKRLAGDNPLLRRTFLHECGIDPAARFNEYPELHGSYRAWLSIHGIDPHTGKMTDKGLAFFRSLVTQQNLENRAKRARRGRA
jgi:hypothetical protein